MQRHAIVGIGEILWDIFPDGPRFGGAPANFACHAASLGGRAWMVSAVGADDLGVQAMATLQRQQVATECVKHSNDYPTGTVQVEVDDSGQARYEFGRDEAWDHLEWSAEIAALAQRSDAVCFGTLGQRSESSRRMIQRFVAATPERALRVFDINLRPPFFDDEVIEQSLGLANVLKLNDDELPVLAATYGLTGSDADRMRELARRFDLRLVALTRGYRGAVLVQGAEISEFGGVDVTVRDTVGAGDAFTAALTLGLLWDNELEEINRHACQVAAFVCSQAGGTPILPAKFKLDFGFEE